MPLETNSRTKTNPNLKGENQAPPEEAPYYKTKINVQYGVTFPSPPKEAQTPDPQPSDEAKPQHRANSARKKFLIGGIVTILASILVKIALPSVGAISSVVTICQVNQVSSAGPFLQRFCALVSPPPPSEQPDRDGIEKLFFMGSWIGKWDDKWLVAFNVQTMTLGAGSEKTPIKVEYLHQENTAENTVTTASYDCQLINVKKIYCPLQIEIWRTNTDEVMAAFHAETRTLKTKLFRLDQHDPSTDSAR